VVSELPARRMVKAFRDAGWTPMRTVGSHTIWKCGCGKHQFTLPDGHRTISPGVVGKAMKALTQCEEQNR
jgi:predicted RNA binding protein YcfA (HicA-like mRNA interferase family)